MDNGHLLQRGEPSAVASTGGTPARRCSPQRSVLQMDTDKLVLYSDEKRCINHVIVPAANNNGVNQSPQRTYKVWVCRR